MDTGYYIGVLVVAIICGFISKAIAESRGMEGGFWWGFFLTIIGIVVVAVRPKENTAENVTNSTITNSVSEHEIINSIKEYKELLNLRKRRNNY